MTGLNPTVTGKPKIYITEKLTFSFIQIAFDNILFSNKAKTANFSGTTDIEAKTEKPDLLLSVLNYD